MKAGIVLGYAIVIFSAVVIGLVGYRGIREINHQYKIAARANRVLVDAETRRPILCVITYTGQVLSGRNG